MTYSERKVYYFNRAGPVNTENSAHFAVERALDEGISTIVVASTSGETARVFCNVIEGTDLRLVVVTHVVGFRSPGESEFSEEHAQYLRMKGVDIVTGTHALSGLERAISRNERISGGSRTEAIAEALRRTVAIGLKVAVECVLIAADQGAIRIDEEVVAAGGTMSGADTVCVILPSHTASFFSLQVREIVAMPRNR